MFQIFVQFTDDKKTAVAAVFSCAQDEKVYPNQGVVSANDERYTSFIKQLLSI